DYEYEIRYHPGKANVVSDKLSRNESIKPRRVRAMRMKIYSGINPKILEAQSKDSKDLKSPAEMLRGLDAQFERKDDGGLYFMDRIWIPSAGNTLQKVLGMQSDMSTTYHPQIDDQSERTIQTLKDMLRARVLDFGGSWDAHLPLFKFSYNNSYYSSIKYASFEALYGRKCRIPVMWAEVGESRLSGPEVKGKLAPRDPCFVPTVLILDLGIILTNLTVKNNDLATYTQRFQELTMIYTKMVLKEEDRVERFIKGLPDNIQGSVMAIELTRLQDAVRMDNNMMDEKLKV
nr:putative reverse transcriptase domain-containing protein [Tanacetum cinerariifolium]